MAKLRDWLSCCPRPAPPAAAAVSPRRHPLASRNGPPPSAEQTVDRSTDSVRWD
jgi:hypothetical protein